MQKTLVVMEKRRQTLWRRNEDLTIGILHFEFATEDRKGGKVSAYVHFGSWKEN